MGYRVDKSTAATKNLGHVGLKHYSRWTFYMQFTSVFFSSGYSSNSNVVDPDLQQPLSLRFSQICIPRLILEGTIMVVSFFFVFLSTVPVIAQMGLALSGERCFSGSRIGSDTGNSSNRNPGGLPFTEAASIASEWL